MQSSVVEHQGSVASSSTVHLTGLSENKYDVTPQHRISQVLLTSMPLVISDLVAVIAANLLAHAAISLFIDYPVTELLRTVPLLCGPFIVANIMFGLYPGTGLNPVFELQQTTRATALLYLSFIASIFLHSGGAALLLLLAVAGFLTMVLVPIVRSSVRKRFSRFTWWGQTVLVSGDHNSAEFYSKALKSNPCFGLKPLVMAEEYPTAPGNGAANCAHEEIGKSSTATGPIGNVSYAIVAVPGRCHFEMLSEFDDSFSEVVTVPDQSDIPIVGNRICDLAVPDSSRLKEKPLTKSSLRKRTMDIILVTIGGLFIMPAVATIAVMIKLDSRGPLIYGQKRIGHNGRVFRAWKFRTMVPDADRVLEQYLAADPQLRKEWEKDCKLKNDPRVTKVGHWLRKMSLDELPQLWNVLVGEMSLVGPRPVPVYEIPRYGDSLKIYKKGTPGLTGLWQVSGRNNTTYTERVQLDNYYSRRRSFWLDVYILARTFRVVFYRDGAY